MTERFLTRQAVFAICRNARGEILLERREGTGYLDGFWDFPSGHVEYDEGVREAMVRELREETGLVAKVEDMKMVHIDNFCFDENYVNYTFRVMKFAGAPKVMEANKCGEMKWFAPDALPAKLTNVVRQNQLVGFSDDLTYSITDGSNYQKLVEEAK